MACLVASVGRETVQMEPGLTPAVGDTVYVSATVAGKGTNVLPAEVSAIGTVADTTTTRGLARSKRMSMSTL